MMAKNPYQTLFALAAMAAAGLLAGCGIGTSPSAVSAPVLLAGPALKGSVYGGQQPISGANIALYAAVTTGYAGATTNILTRSVTTDAAGFFNITGAYSCSAGQQLYIVASGGNPGSGNNANVVQMAPLGDCSTLTPSTFISMNEITTVAGAFALAPFTSSISALGTSPTNLSGLAHAFVSVNKLVNTGTGLAPGSALPAGATAPTAELYTLANILATCVNSTGGTAGDGTLCGKLFTLATPPGGAAPTNTFQAALNIAHFPTQNVAALFNSPGSLVPFNPQLSVAPSDWTLAVSYKAAGQLNSPKTTTVDAAGNIWIANSGSNSVTVLTQAGAPFINSPLTGNGLNAPSAVAIDVGGNAWVTNSGGSTPGANVSVFTASGSVYSGSPFGGSGTISAPTSVAIDAPGNIWIANSGSNSVTELSSTGSFVKQISQGNNSPTSLVINPK